MDRIQKLEAKIQRIKEEEADKKKAKFQYLVGQCLHRAHTSYEKITAIDRVNTDRYGDEITFDCIHVHFDNRGDEYNSGASIQLDGYGSDYVDDIDKHIISLDDFNRAFDACVDLITRKIKNR